MDLNYELIIKKLKEGTFTLGHMMKLQRRGLFSRLEKLDISEDEESDMNPEEQLEMLNLMAEMIYILIRAPKEMTPEDIAFLIPMDKIEELSLTLNEVFERMGNMSKNSQAANPNT